MKRRIFSPKLFIVLSGAPESAWTRWGTYLACCSQEGRSLELRLRRGVGQAAHTLNKPQVECTGVLLCVIRE